VAALAAAVVREALISRLKWGAALAGTVVLLVALIGTFQWSKPSPGQPEDLRRGLPRESSSTFASVPALPREQRTALPADLADGREMILHVIADESDQPLADIAVQVEFNILSKPVRARFVTDAGGAARIMLPADPLNGMNYWVSAPGRVPMTVSWNSKASVASLLPGYTLRVPQGRFVAGTVVDETGQ